MHEVLPLRTIAARTATAVPGQIDRKHADPCGTQGVERTDDLPRARREGRAVDQQDHLLRFHRTRGEVVNMRVAALHGQRVAADSASVHVARLQRGDQVSTAGGGRRNRECEEDRTRVHRPAPRVTSLGRKTRAKKNNEYLRLLSRVPQQPQQRGVR